MESWKEELYSSSYGNDFCHYGVEGQKWGIRRYQNKDGTLTEEGKRRYGEKATDDKERISNLMEDYSSIKNETKGWTKTAVEGAITAGVFGASAPILYVYGNVPAAAIAASGAAITAGITAVSGIMAAKGTMNLNWVKKELARNEVGSNNAKAINKDYAKAMKKTNKLYKKGRINEVEYLNSVNANKAFRNKLAYAASVIRKSGIPFTSDAPKNPYPIKDAFDHPVRVPIRDVPRERDKERKNK